MLWLLIATTLADGWRYDGFAADPTSVKPAHPTPAPEGPSVPDGLPTPLPRPIPPREPDVEVMVEVEVEVQVGVGMVPPAATKSPFILPGSTERFHTP
jgi:hypothetical protein